MWCFPLAAKVIVFQYVNTGLDHAIADRDSRAAVAAWLYPVICCMRTVLLIAWSEIKRCRNRRRHA